MKSRMGKPFKSAASSNTRRTVLVLTAVGVCAGLTLSGPVAQAQPNVSVSCDASGKAHFSPGVQMFPLPQQIDYQGNDGRCTDHSGMGVQSAQFKASFEGVIISCLGGGMGTGSGTGTITWKMSDGTQRDSQVDLEIDESVLNTAMVSGHVTRGPFQNQGFSGEFTTDLFDGAGKCTVGAPWGGVKEANFTGRYSIN